MKKISQNQSLATDSQVHDYLDANPNFFSDSKNHTLLKKLKIPHLRETTLSLLEYQIHIFREENEELLQQLKSIVEINSINQEVLHRFFGFIQSMIEIQTTHQLIEVFIKTWKDVFAVNAITLMFPEKASLAEYIQNTQKQSSAFSNMFSIVAISKRNQTKKIRDAIASHSVVCGTINRFTKKYFSSKLDRGSYICIPSGKKESLCYIFLGSNDSKRFSSDMRSDLVSFVCNVFALLLYTKTLPSQMRSIHASSTTNE